MGISDDTSPEMVDLELHLVECVGIHWYLLGQQ